MPSAAAPRRDSAAHRRDSTAPDGDADAAATTLVNAAVREKWLILLMVASKTTAIAQAVSEHVVLNVVRRAL